MTKFEKKFRIQKLWKKPKTISVSALKEAKKWSFNDETKLYHKMTFLAIFSILPWLLTYFWDLKFDFFNLGSKLNYVYFCEFVCEFHSEYIKIRECVPVYDDKVFLIVCLFLNFSWFWQNLCIFAKFFSLRVILGILKSWETDKLKKKNLKIVEKIMF